MMRKSHPAWKDNVLSGLGHDGAVELSAKAVLATKLNALIDKRGLSQTAAAEITGMTQPKVSQLRRNKLQNISLGDVLFLPALNFLFLMGLVEYRPKTDAVEYVGPNEAI